MGKKNDNKGKTSESTKQRTNKGSNSTVTHSTTVRKIVKVRGNE